MPRIPRNAVVLVFAALVSSTAPAAAQAVTTSLEAPLRPVAAGVEGIRELELDVAGLERMKRILRREGRIELTGFALPDGRTPTC